MKVVTGVVCSALILLMSSPAHSTVKTARYTLVDGMQLDIDVFPGLIVKFAFPSRVKTASVAHDNDYRPVLDHKEVKLIVRPDAGVSSLHFKLYSGEHVAARLIPRESSKITLLHTFDPPEGKNAAPSTPLQRLAQMDQRFDFDPAFRAVWKQGEYELSLDTTQFVYEGAALKLKAKVENLCSINYPVSKIQILDKDMIEYEGGHVQLQDSSLPVKVGPDRTIEFSLLVEHPDDLGKEWNLRLVSSNKALPAAVFKIMPMKTTWPARRKPGHLEGRTLVRFRAFGGATSLDDGPDIGIGTGRKAWSMVQGVGGYVEYGKFKHINFGGGVDVLRSREVTIATGASSVTTRTTGTRVYASTTVHTGRRLIAYGRVGLGFTFASHRFEVNNDTDSEFRLAGLFMVGSGIDWKISRRLLVGIDGGVSVPLGGQVTGLAFEGAARFGVMFGGR